MEKSYFNLVILFVLYVLGTINANATFLVKKPEFVNKIIRLNVLEQVNTETLTICVYRCVRDLGCVSLFYNQNQKSCQTHSVLFITPGDGVVETGTNYYSIYEEGCPADFIRHRRLDLCYKPYTETLAYDFGEAIDACQQNGYVLVRGKTDEDYTHISDQLMASTDYGIGFWVAGSDAEVEGVWKLENGKIMTAFAWAPGEPDNSTSGKDYVYLKRKNGVYQMSDTAFTLDAFYICQLL